MDNYNYNDNYVSQFGYRRFPRRGYGYRPFYGRPGLGPRFGPGYGYWYGPSPFFRFFF